jgi:selenocysteine-specific elongation factor
VKSVIVGTAGHIDHGKTALVNALTGIDADRLQEEKRRGITIDIGFAHLHLPGPGGEPIRLGFIDVPGHERFVRNMLAGVGGIDLVLLVIAADESIKPQTREHFEICRLLNIPRGITVLTKADLVDKDTLDVVRLEVEDFLRGSFLDVNRAPIIPLSSLTGVGVDDLKRQLARVAVEVPAKNAASVFRLPIDRVFTMKGFGTVVTGTLISGRVHKEEEVDVLPLARRARVRGIQVHNRTAEQAAAGERTALNLAGFSPDELSRGMTLTAPGLFRSTNRVDVSLTVLAGSRPIKDRARVHFHAYTSETVAEVLLYEGKEVKAGQSGLAQLRLQDPTLFFPGDRFILRQFSPVVTIGGGVVLENQPQKLPRSEYPQWLLQLADGSRASALHARVVARGGKGLTLSDALARTGWPRGELESLLASMQDVRRAEETWIHEAAWKTLQSNIQAVLDAFHGQNPLSTGIRREELRSHFPEVGAEVFESVLAQLVLQRKIELAGDLVRLAGRSVTMKDEEAEAKKTIESAFANAGLKAPYLKDVIAGLAVDKARAQQIVTLLLRDKVLIKVSDELVFHRTALEHLRKVIVEQKKKTPKIDVAAFKDLIGVTRRYAIPLLEYLDRERVTRRVGDAREIL